MSRRTFIAWPALYGWTSSHRRARRWKTLSGTRGDDGCNGRGPSWAGRGRGRGPGAGGARGGGRGAAAAGRDILASRLGLATGAAAGPAPATGKDGAAGGGISA